MTRLISVAVFFLALTGAAAAAEPAKKSLDPAGSFHQVHTQKLQLNCDGCHGKRGDVLFLRGKDTTPSASPGPVNRSVCLACHSAPNQPAWYGTSKR